MPTINYYGVTTATSASAPTRIEAAYNRAEAEKRIIKEYGRHNIYRTAPNSPESGYTVVAGADTITLDKWGDVFVEKPLSSEQLQKEKENMFKNFCTIAADGSVNFDIGLDEPLKLTGLTTRSGIELDEFLVSAYKYYKTNYSSNGSNAYFKGRNVAEAIHGETYTVHDKEQGRITPLAVNTTVIKSCIELLGREVANTRAGLKTSEQNIAHHVKQNLQGSFVSALISFANQRARERNVVEALAQYESLLAGKVSHITVAESLLNVNMIKTSVNSLLRAKNKGVKHNYFYLKFQDNGELAESHLRFVYDSLNRSASHFSNNNTIKLSIAISPTAKVNSKLTLLRMYPILKKELKVLKVQARYLTTSKIYNIDFSTAQTIWTKYNEIKNKIMLLGWKEHETSNFISKFILKEPTAACAITNQFVPISFMVSLTKPDKTKVMASWFAIYDVRGDGNGGVSARYRMVQISSNPDVRVYEELNLSTPAKLGSNYPLSVRNHSANALAYLSIRSLPEENIKVVGEYKGYQPTPFMGIELEVERRDGCREDITEPVQDLLGRDFIILKTDGSLRGHRPFEIVTVPATLEYHRMKWQAFMEDKDIKGQLTSYASGHCGMHVHMSRDSFTGLHLAKFMRFLNCADNYSFVTRVAQRQSNGYAQYMQQRTLAECKQYLTRGVHGMTANGAGHYDAINTSNEHTIEVRIFRGNLGKVQFYKNLEFVHAVWSYTRIAGMNEIGYKDFLLWLFKNNEKTYSNLTKWLAASGYTVSNLVVKRTFSELEKAKLKDKSKVVKKVQAAVAAKYKFKYTDVGERTTLTHLGKVPVEEVLQSA